MNTDEKVKISFDSEFKIRVLEESKFKRSQELDKESSSFVEKITTFNDKVNNLVDVLESHATRIEAQKLKAIGLRMAAENEVEQRSRQQRAVQSIISEKRAELDRYTSQFQSLERVEAEQKVILEKMMNVSN